MSEWMSDWTEPRVMTEHKADLDKLDQVSRRLETMSEYGAKTAGELAQAIELLKLAQGHMLATGADWTRREDVEAHDSLTKRVFEFLEAHTPQDQKTAAPVAVWSARRWAQTVQWNWEILKNGERVGVCSEEAAPENRGGDECEGGNAVRFRALLSIALYTFLIFCAVVAILLWAGQYAA
jgi:hypothetical protein